MKRKKIFLIIIILVALCSITYYLFTNQNIKNDDISHKVIIKQELSKEKFKIEKLYLEKSEDIIADEKFVGVRDAFKYVINSIDEIGVTKSKVILKGECFERKVAR